MRLQSAHLSAESLWQRSHDFVSFRFQILDSQEKERVGNGENDSSEEITEFGR